MGTRHLIAVYLDGDYKIAQYGQWDGCPAGQGVKVLEFLSAEKSVDNLKLALARVRYLDPAGKDKEFVDDYNKRAPKFYDDPETRTDRQIEWWDTYISRDLGADILTNIANSNDNEMVLKNHIDFAGDSQSCTWAYIIDLDKGTFEIYKGFNTLPLTEDARFYRSPRDVGSQYYPVKLLVSFELNNLPTIEDFLSLTEIDKNEEDKPHN